MTPEDKARIEEIRIELLAHDECKFIDDDAYLDHADDLKLLFARLDEAHEKFRTIIRVGSQVLKDPQDMELIIGSMQRHAFEALGEE